jgi:hypothetical protein
VLRLNLVKHTSASMRAHGWGSLLWRIGFSEAWACSKTQHIQECGQVNIYHVVWRRHQTVPHHVSQCAGARSHQLHHSIRHFSQLSQSKLALTQPLILQRCQFSSSARRVASNARRQNRSTAIYLVCSAQRSVLFCPAMMLASRKPLICCRLI